MRRLQQLALMIPLAFGVTACTDGGNTLLILGNQTPSADGLSCTFDTNLDTTALTAGIFDLRSPLLYQMFPVLQNSATGVNTDLNQDVVLIEGFDIEVSFPGGFLDAVPEPQRQILQDNSETTVLRSFSIPPVSQAVTSIDVFNPPFVQALLDSNVFANTAVRALVEVKVEAFGEIDGSTITSTPFTFPVTLCLNCLFFDSGDCGDPLQPADFGLPCGFIQDQTTVCCLSQMGDLLCGVQ